MFDLSPYRVLIAVFGMPECPACEAYIPRLVERVEALRAAGAKISIYDPTSTTPVPTDSALVVIYDVSSEDASVQTGAPEDRILVVRTALMESLGSEIILHFPVDAEPYSIMEAEFEGDDAIKAVLIGGNVAWDDQGRAAGLGVRPGFGRLLRNARS